MQKKAHSEESKMLSQSAVFSFTLYIILLLGVLRGFLVAKFLGPALYGMRNLFGVFIDYNAYTHFGTLFAMNREVPHYRGRGEEKKAELMVASTFWANLCTVVVIATIFISISFYLRIQNYDQNHCDLLLFTGIIIITSRLVDFYSTKLKLENKFFLLSRIQLVSSSISIFSCIALTYYYSLRGFFIGHLIGDAIFVFSAVKVEKKFPPLIVSIPILQELVKVGAPILGAAILLMVLNSADKIMIVSLLSETALGYYGIAAIATSVIGTVPKAIYSVTLPRLMEKYGKTNDLFQIKNYFVEPTIFLAYFLPFLLSLIYLTIHIPIEYYLSRYIESIIIVKILALGLFFSALPVMATSICYAIKERMSVIYLTIPPLIINIVSNYTLIHLGYGLTGVAIGTALSYFTYCSSLLWYTMKKYKMNLGEHLKFYIIVYSPFLYSSILLIVLDQFVYFRHDSFWPDATFTFAKLLIFYALYCPILFFIRKQTAFAKFTTHLKSILSRKGKRPA